MANELTHAERTRGQALMAGLAAGADGVLDGAMPGLSAEDGTLVLQVLLGVGADTAAQMLAFNRGENANDVLIIGPDGVARPAPIAEDPAPLD